MNAFSVRMLIFRYFCQRALGGGSPRTLAKEFVGHQDDGQLIFLPRQLWFAVLGPRGGRMFQNCVAHDSMVRHYFHWTVNPDGLGLPSEELRSTVVRWGSWVTALK